MAETFGWKPLFSYGRILAVLTEAASGDLQQCISGVRYQQDALVVAALCPILFLWSAMMMTYFLCCGTPPLLQIQMTISSSIRCRAGSPLRVILNSSTETQSGSTAFPFASERMTSVSSCIGAELLEACSRATGQGLGQCSGRASVTWRSGDHRDTGPIVRS